ncbi:MAG: MFS transporter [Solirubrobacteraceae bacterium]
MATEHRGQWLRRQVTSLRLTPRGVVRLLLASLREQLGGPARLHVIVLFACVLGLSTADLASLGAIASKLKPALHLDNAQLGVLAAAPSLVAALATLPMGVLADHARRVRLLAAAVALWSAGMVLAGACASFEQLLIVRLFLGAATAASAPLVASLVGDLFWPNERGRIWGYILAGELLGGGFGLIVAGNIAGLSWRAALSVLAIPSLAIAAGLWKGIPEPARGGASRVPRGAERLEPEPKGSTKNRSHRHVERTTKTHKAPVARGSEVARALKEAGASPRPELVLDRNPQGMSIWHATRYVLRIRTNVALIVASSLGYFFQSGVNTFGVVFVIASFGVSQPVATWLLAAIALGALAGTILGGRLADTMLARGHPAARMVVGGGAFVLSALLFVPAILSHDLAIALPIYILAAVGLGAPNAPMDAARLDIVPGLLWGRAEAIRNMLRTLAVAAAPLLFGFLSDALATSHHTATKGLGYQASGPGLRDGFLLMLIPMIAGGLIILRNAGRYTRDVATAIASDENINRHGSERAG